MEYDTEYMKKYDDDLNTTLIFVRCRHCPHHHARVDNVHRLVYSPQSVPPSSSTYNPSSSQIPPNGRKPTSGRFFSASIRPPLRVKTLRFLRRGMVHLRRSSQPQTSSIQAFLCHCWPRSSRCWASNGSTGTSDTPEDRWSNAAATASANSTASRGGRSAYSSMASLSCSKSPSFSSPVGCRDTYGPSTHPSPASSSPSPSSGSSSTSGLWLLERLRMSAHSKLQHRRLSGTSETGRQSRDCWRVWFRQGSF